MSPILEEADRAALRSSPSVEHTDMLVDPDDPLPDAQPPRSAAGQQVSPSLLLTDDIHASTSQMANSRQSKPPPKSSSRTGSGGSSASAQPVNEPSISGQATKEAVSVAERTELCSASSDAPGQLIASQSAEVAAPIFRTTSGGVKRQRSRGDADRLEVSGAPADDLHGLIQAALRQADQKAEVIKTLVRIFHRSIYSSYIAA